MIEGSYRLPTSLFFDDAYDTRVFGGFFSAESIVLFPVFSPSLFAPGILISVSW